MCKAEWEYINNTITQGLQTNNSKPGGILWWVHVHKVCELQHLWEKLVGIGKTEKPGNKCKTFLQCSAQIFNTNWIQWFCKNNIKF